MAGYAVPLAAQAGATVTVTAGACSRDRVRSYGADRIVNHAVIPVVQTLAGQHFDLVLQLAPASPRRRPSWRAWSANGGAFVSVTTPGPQDAGRGVRTVYVFARNDVTQLAGLVARVDAGDLAIEVAERLRADQAAVRAPAAAGELGRQNRPGPSRAVPTPPGLPDQLGGWSSRSCAAGPTAGRIPTVVPAGGVQPA